MGVRERVFSRAIRDIAADDSRKHIPQTNTRAVDQGRRH